MPLKPYPKEGVVGAVAENGKSWCWVHRSEGALEVVSLYREIGDCDSVATVVPGPVVDGSADWYDVSLSLDAGGCLRFRIDIPAYHAPAERRPSWAVVREMVVSMWRATHSHQPHK